MRRVILVAALLLAVGCESASFNCFCYRQRSPAAVSMHDYDGKAGAWPAFAEECKAACAPFATTP